MIPASLLPLPARASCSCLLLLPAAPACCSCLLLLRPGVLELAPQCGRKPVDVRIPVPPSSLSESGYLGGFRFIMEETRESAQCPSDAIWDGLKRVGDISYAIVPTDVAHALGDLKKALLTNLRSCIDWEIDWVNDRVAGGDRLREEWQEKCRQRSTETPPEPVV